MLVIDTRIKLLLFIFINFMVFGLKDFILGSVCFFFICILSCLMGQKKIVLKYLVFYVVIAAIQQLCIYLPQAIETILSIFTLFIRVMIPVVLFASTFIATTKVSELIAAMYSLKIPRSITITFAMVLRFFPTFSEEIHNIYDAMKLRGIALSWKNVFTRPMLILEAIAIPIVMRSASIAEELSASAVTRGIDNTPARLELPETMPSRNDTPAVEVKDLAIGYEKGKPVAQHLNFRVYPGEIVGVVGKNGCGKSTLARTLCGLQKELRGEVLYQNSMIPSKRRIRKAYLVMQDPDYQLFTDSVYQELLLALSDQKDKDEKRIDDILDELNLTIYKERHPMSLSGGQKQRTAIGVAALRDAEVLIFDEPTSGLDYKNMESVAGILSALSKRGKAILVISHDNELLMKICSRVIRMDEKTSS